LAIEAYRHRDPSKVVIPDVRSEVIAGFSLEQIEELLSNISHNEPFHVLIDAIRTGQLRGIALMAGCNNQRAEQDLNHVTIAAELLKNDVLVLATGCSAGALAKNGFLSSAATETFAGPGLKKFIHDLENANKVALPPVWHVGSCVDNTRAMNLATEIARRLKVDVDSIPFVASAPEANHEKAVSIGTWLVAFGLTVHVGTINYVGGSPLVLEVLTNTTGDVFGGRFIFEPNPVEASKKLANELERRRWKLGWSNTYFVPESPAIEQKELIQMAIDGAIIATGYADLLLSVAIELHGYDERIEFPETGYSLPAIFAWEGKEVHCLGDMPAVLGDARSIIRHEPTYENALAAGEATMVAAELIEALKYDGDENPYKGTPYCGFIPDKVLRELGIAFVDDTIPGAAVLIGTASDPKKLVKIVRDCQSKGMLIIASFDTIRQLKDEGIRMGLDAMLYPVGEFTQVVHGLNFAIRAALTFGNVQKGDRERLQNYLRKRPKVFVLQLGPIDAIKAATEFAVLLNGSPTITDQQIEAIPEKYISQPNYEHMVQTAIELRGIQVKLAPVKIPVAYGPAFEGETVRRPETYIEAGGASKTPAFELLRVLPEDQVEDGTITLIGKDVDEMPEGGKTPLAILIDVYGKKMQEEFEPVLERRIHQFINFAEGAWHTGQRNTIWVRLSKNSVKAGLRFRHFGEILITKLKAEFGNIVSRVQVTIITDGAKIEELMPLAKAKYATRDERLLGLTDEAVDTFMSCSLCQSFAPDHICIVTPERLGLCGAVNYLDAKAGKEIAPTGPNQPITKGDAIDAVKGQWRGVNESVFELSHHKLERFNAYTMMEDPMTSCGCFEVIVAMTADAQAVVLVNREFPGMTPVGMKFSTLAGSIGGGKQTPGFIGVGRKYILSKKFIPADGGFLRIAWMPKELKAQMMESLRRRAEELGVPDFVDKIADESVTTEADGLVEWMAKVNHPALAMPPLLQ
jgi:acetyl-CoA synthase